MHYYNGREIGLMLANSLLNYFDPVYS